MDVRLFLLEAGRFVVAVAAVAASKESVLDEEADEEEVAI